MSSRSSPLKGRRDAVLDPGHAMRAERIARAAQLRDYFALQLRLAEAVAEQTRRPLAETVTQLTNLYRRFGHGRYQSGAIAPAWARYTATLQALPTHRRRLTWTQACFVQSPSEPLPPSARQFGCFGYDPPDDDGVVRIHFTNRDPDDVGPLSRAKMERRRHELTAMVATIRRQHPEARRVRGMSWLYHLAAYRRLFPPGYGEARVVLEGRTAFQGSSSWGQFLDHREAVKPALRARFLHNLARLRVDRLWEVFPLPTYRTEAPLDAFANFYGIGQQQGRVHTAHPPAVSETP